jgi:hypothetical protein
MAVQLPQVVGPVMGYPQFGEFPQIGDPDRIRILMKEQLISQKGEPPGGPGSLFRGNDGRDERMVVFHNSLKVNPPLCRGTHKV